MGTDVRLLSFAAADTSRQLRGRIEGLGYAVRELDGAAWLQCPDNQFSATVALFEAPRMSARMLPDLARYLEPEALLALFPSEASIDPEFLCLSADIAFWPCPENELNHRLARLERRSLVAPEPDRAPELEAFRRLNIIGESPRFQSALARVQQILHCDVPVLLQGETGTGKEVFARAIHYLGPRQDAAFVPVNCGAIPDDLIESELYGYVRGAFTDAKQSQTGLVDLADKGTLFLDEIDSLSPQGQVSLLRFLQNQEFRPIGGRRFKRVNVRVVVAGNRPLKRLTEERTFREDLYYRLNLFPVELPALRERQDDIVPLARHFLDRFERQYGMLQRVFTQDAVAWLSHHPWPGNVRELENAVHRACLVVRDGGITARDLAGETPDDLLASIDFESDDDMSPSFAAAKQHAVQAFERSYLENLLRKTQGNISAAARLAGKERRSLGKLLKKHGIDRIRFA